MQHPLARGGIHCRRRHSVANPILSLLRFHCRRDLRSRTFGGPRLLARFDHRRECLDVRLNTLMSNLPDDLLEISLTIPPECSGMYLASEMRDTRTCRASLIKTFNRTKGSHVVTNHLSSVCAACGSFMAQRIDNKRGHIWAEVPSYFGFPEWSVLQGKLKRIVGPQSEVAVVSLVHCTLVSEH